MRLLRALVILGCVWLLASGTGWAQAVAGSQVSGVVQGFERRRRFPASRSPSPRPTPATTRTVVHRRGRRVRLPEPAGRSVPAEGRRCRASTPTCRTASSCRSAPTRRSTSTLAVGSDRRAGHGHRRTPTMVETRSTGVGQVIDNQRVIEIAAERPAGDRADLPRPAWPRPRRPATSTPTRTIRPSRSRWPAARPTASPTSWTAAPTTIRSTT